MASSPVGGEGPLEEAQEAGEDSMLHPLSPVAPSVRFFNKLVLNNIAIVL